MQYLHGQHYRYLVENTTNGMTYHNADCRRMAFEKKYMARRYQGDIYIVDDIRIILQLYNQRVYSTRWVRNIHPNQLWFR